MILDIRGTDLRTPARRQNESVGTEAVASVWRVVPSENLTIRPSCSARDPGRIPYEVRRDVDLGSRDRLEPSKGDDA